MLPSSSDNVIITEVTPTRPAGERRICDILTVGYIHNVNRRHTTIVLKECGLIHCSHPLQHIEDYVRIIVISVNIVCIFDVQFYA